MPYVTTSIPNSVAKVQPQRYDRTELVVAIVAAAALVVARLVLAHKIPARDNCDTRVAIVKETSKVVAILDPHVGPKAMRAVLGIPIISLLLEVATPNSAAAVVGGDGVVVVEELGTSVCVVVLDILLVASVVVVE